MKHCQKCNKEFPTNDNFCDICGSKLSLKKGDNQEKEISHKESKKEVMHNEDKKSYKGLWITLGIIGGIILIIFLISIFTTPNYKQFSIKLDVIKPTIIDGKEGWSLNDLVESPPYFKSYNLSYYGDVTREPIALVIYTNYQEEKIFCGVQEYYSSEVKSGNDIVLSKTSQLTVFGNKNNFVFDFTELFFPINLKPKQVKYIVKCTGEKSGYTDSKTFTLNLDYKKVVKVE